MDLMVQHVKLSRECTVIDSWKQFIKINKLFNKQSMVLLRAICIISVPRLCQFHVTNVLINNLNDALVQSNL